MIDPETETVNQHGSNKGIQFLLQNETVALKFMDFCGKRLVNTQQLHGRVAEEKEGGGEFYWVTYWYNIPISLYKLFKNVTGICGQF